ncbi:M20/M25/M40 family metallo-hydrolase [Candidatus Woesearchaeota archaeon]|nr:M20/M25/M40 family metallo-hydrolase [Candidatus Woesearchaeota archaeon]
MAELLKKLISINSVSGNEKEIADFLEKHLKKLEIVPKRIGDNLIVKTGSGKKTVMLVSHIDTVPAGGSWTEDPFSPMIKENRIYGLGASDNKSNVALLLKLISGLKPNKLNGKVIFAFTTREETDLSGIKTVLGECEKPDYAIITEPTGLIPCSCQKGLVILKGESTGKRAHASTPEKGENAIVNAVDDIKKLSEIRFEKKHKLLGFPKLSVTKISAGVSHNIIPEKCEFTIDARTTPEYYNEKIIHLIKKNINSKIIVKSKRLKSSETDPDNELIRKAEKICSKKPQGFSAFSEMSFFSCPAVILGCGKLEQAHKPDEFIDINNYKKGLFILEKLVTEILK